MPKQQPKIKRLKPSSEAVEVMGRKRKREFVGKVPICPFGHPSWAARKDFIEKTLARIPQGMRDGAVMPDVCDKAGLKKFEIYCNKCGDKLGTVWARNKTLRKWCSFRYECWHDKKGWHGCLTPNVSPYTGMLRLECCCGNDNREFVGKPAKEKENRVGRAYDRRDSKFKVKGV